jgi:hypothetical protein
MIQHKTLFRVHALCLLTWCCLLSGCSSKSSVKASVNFSGAAVPPPAMIYVSDFYLNPAMIQSQTALRQERFLRRELDQVRGDDPESQAKKLIRALSDGIVESLKKAGLPAEAMPNRVAALRPDFFPENAQLPSSGWLVGGWFTRVDEGNRAMQAAVGFGMGAEKADTQVMVSDLGNNPREPFLIIGTETGSSTMPGGLVTKNPYVMAAKFVMARGATERDVKRQGAAIAQKIVDYIKSGPTPKN